MYYSKGELTCGGNDLALGGGGGVRYELGTCINTGHLIVWFLHQLRLVMGTNSQGNHDPIDFELRKIVSLCLDMQKS
jgi:hypothetical protein